MAASLTILVSLVFLFLYVGHGHAQGGNLPNQLTGTTQTRVVPLVADTTLSRSSPHISFVGDTSLTISPRDSALLTFNRTGVFNGRDIVVEAYLTLTSTVANSPRIFVAHGIIVSDPFIENGTWYCENDLKKTNRFRDCAVAWKGGFLSEPDAASDESKIKSGKLRIDVSDILNSGVNAILVRIRKASAGSFDFHSLESDHAPTLEIVIPSKLDNIDQFPNCPGGRRKNVTVVGQNQTLNFDVGHCPPSHHLANPINYVFTNGIPWNNAVNFALTQTINFPRLLDEGNVWFPSIFCTGSTSCPSNSSFLYGVVNTQGVDSESDILARLLFDVLGLDNIVLYTWDRSTVWFIPVINSHTDKFRLIVPPESWMNFWICSDEQAALPPAPPGETGKCNQYGWNIERCVGVDGFGNCVERGVSFFADVICGRSEVIQGVARRFVETSGCLNDGLAIGVSTDYFHNITLASPSAFGVRKQCYALNGVLVAEVEIGGSESTPGFLLQFTPDNLFGTTEVPSPSQLAEFNRRTFTAPLGAVDRQGNYCPRAGSATFEGYPAAGQTFTTTGVTPADELMAAQFRLYTNISRTLTLADRTDILYLEFNDGVNPVAVPGSGGPLILIPSPELLQNSWWGPALGYMRVSPHFGHASPHTNPEVVIKLIADLTDETVKSVA